MNEYKIHVTLTVASNDDGTFDVPTAEQVQTALVEYLDGEGIEFNVTAVDLDGDEVEVAWTVNDAVASGDGKVDLTDDGKARLSERLDLLDSWIQGMKAVLL